MALVDIANNAGGKLGGFGDQLGGNAFITAGQLTANTDKVSQWVNEKYPIVKKKVIKEFTSLECPFKETLKFADLGDDLKQDDVAISSITSVAGVVTFVTDEAHELSVSDTRFLADIQGDASHLFERQYLHCCYCSVNNIIYANRRNWHCFVGSHSRLRHSK